MSRDPDTPAGICCYIVQCADGTLYTGWTADVVRRLQDHNAGRGGHYTRARRPVRLIYTEAQPDARTARQREVVLKRLPRAAKLALAEETDQPAAPPSPPPSDCIYHLLAAAEWEGARGNRTYAPTSLTTDGFIHCSTLGQVEDVADRFFPGRRDILILRIDPTALGVPLRYEESEPGRHYPHVYGALSLEAVAEERLLERDGGGRARLPEAWRSAA